MTLTALLCSLNHSSIYCKVLPVCSIYTDLFRMGIWSFRCFLKCWWTGMIFYCLVELV